MKKNILLLLLSGSVCFAETQYQEITLDALKNKKVYVMSVDEFEKIKQQDEYTKEQMKFKKVASKKEMVEIIIDNTQGEVLETKEIIPEIKITGKTLESTISIPSVQTTQEIKPETSTSQLVSLGLESGISYFLTKYKDLTVYEFEESKSIILEKIKKDSRFDIEALNSMNILTLNKMQFIDFLSDIKNSMKDR